MKIYCLHWSADQRVIYLKDYRAWGGTVGLWFDFNSRDSQQAFTVLNMISKKSSFELWRYINVIS